MSEEGKLRRGEQYHNMRDRDGNYPGGITSNPSKMADLKVYLDSIKPKEPSKKEKKGE